MLKAGIHKLIYGRHRAARRYQPLNRIELHRSAVLNNFRLLQSQHPDFSIMPVLKANAYGHGLAEMAQILNDVNCDLLAVDGYFEAAKIRFQTKHRILVLGYIKPENVALLDIKRCSFVVQDASCLSAFGLLRRPVKVHLELNTGMNRLGLVPSEVDSHLKVLKSYPSLELEGIMTHLADADNVSNDFTDTQVELFDKQVKHIIAKGFRPKYIHIAQTAGSTKVSSQTANGIRLGIGLYGINPLMPKDPHHDDLKGLEPVLELISTIIKVNDLKPGDKVSYSGIFTAPKAMRIATLPLGYYEGVPRSLSNIGVVSQGNLILPVVGRICMNHTMIGLNGNDLKVGDEITVISSDPLKPNSVVQICSANKLFAYSLLTGISDSIRREIVS